MLTIFSSSFIIVREDFSGSVTAEESWDKALLLWKEKLRLIDIFNNIYRNSQSENLYKCYHQIMIHLQTHYDIYLQQGECRSKMWYC